MTNTSINDVIGFIAGHADENDINLIHQTIKTRNSLLKSQRQSDIKIGDQVELLGLSPKYLNGLMGVVSQKGTRSSIVLDERSTGRLRIAGRKRFWIAPDANEYELTGIPAGCMKSVA